MAPIHTIVYPSKSNLREHTMHNKCVFLRTEWTTARWWMWHCKWQWICNRKQEQKDCVCATVNEINFIQLYIHPHDNVYSLHIWVSTAFTLTTKSTCSITLYHTESAEAHYTNCHIVSMYFLLSISILATFNRPPIIL